MNSEIVKINNKEYSLDINRATELGILKSIDNCPKSWNQYVSFSRSFGINATWDRINAANVYSSKYWDKQTAFVALGKLIQLRNAWWGNWRPDWTDIIQQKYCIVVRKDEVTLDMYSVSQAILAFPTKETAEEFYKCFKNLIEQAKMFL